MGDPGKYSQCRAGGGRRQWDEKGAQYKIWVVMRRAELGKGDSKTGWVWDACCWLRPEGGDE